MKEGKVQITTLIITLSVGLFFGFLGGNYYSVQQVVVENPLVKETIPKTVSLMFDFGDGSIKTFADIEIRDQETMSQLVERVALENELGFESEEYEGLGSLITTIGSKTGGEGDKYWQYWVGNMHADVGADLYKVQPGDVIEWKFIGFQSNEE